MKAHSRFIYPAETSRHVATILGFPSPFSTPPFYYERSCREIAALAHTISRFEPVRLFARSEDMKLAESLVRQGHADTSRISITPFATNHLWVRDTGPVYVISADADCRNSRFAVNFQFNEWGGKFPSPESKEWLAMGPEHFRENTTFAERIITSDHTPSSVTCVSTPLCLEGGALVCDGDGTLIATESSIVGDERNPNLSKATIEGELRRLLGVSKIIWLPGQKGLDVTDVHADAEVQFIRPGVLVQSRPHNSASIGWIEVYERTKSILQEETDARGRKFEIHTLDEPNPDCLCIVLGDEEPATNYVNFYFVNGGLVIPKFGDSVADERALRVLQDLCPDRLVQQVHVTALPILGGVIHCATQPVPDLG